ncbi:MAG TPA: rhomboid family intramembrane serine protease [Candidatus Eisenbergiella stercorigallinarum]|uniref:Rhomboid family intramembrane serine protease n=1 Tax=Candidatus Eisenbergiella stercorigallinarum TaxID=2838557 RepID=A0A9D2R2P8_9FIRM|nr:rhomboid family intramembrane serine protease [Candidatus Eisenbergiella stercorigallinarum]
MRTQQFGGEMRRYPERIPWCSAVLTAVNIVVFLACQFYGSILYPEGAFSILYLIRNGEYYRLVTAMFLHADISHLANNMILLYFGGEIVEKTVGRIRYLILFFLSGICGNLFSAVYELSTGSFYESIGASGAVFGLVGGLFYLVLAKKGRAAGMSVQRMVLMIALSLYSGFQSVMVNNAAHLGGLLGGFLLAFLLCHVGRLPQERIRQAV